MSVISITDEAATALRNIIADQSFPENVAVRLGVEGGGCSGFSYAMNFDEEGPTDKDEVLNLDGIKFYVDRKSVLYLEGIIVDFHEDLMQRGFVFKNPNATGTCGCGQSFSV